MRTLLTALLLCTSGCATIATRYDDHFNAADDAMYPATLADCYMVGSIWDQMDGGCFSIFFTIIVLPDFIPSVVTDTVIFPYDFTIWATGTRAKWQRGH